MHLQTLFLAVVTAATARLAYILYTLLNSPLRPIPGPFLARVTKLWYLLSVYKGQAQWDNINLHREYAKDGAFYAPIVRLGPRMYSITRPEKAVYGISSKMPKSAWYEGWKHPSPDRWTLFTDRDIKRHAETRRKFQSMYSLTSLLHYEPFVDSVGDVFQTRLSEMATSGESVNLHHWLQCYAFDVIGNITYGRRFGFLDEGKDIDRCMTSLESSMIYSTLVGIYAWAHPYLYHFLEKYFPNSGAAGRSYIMSFVRAQISRRQHLRELAKAKGERPGPEDADAPRDFLDLALDAEQDEEKGMTKYNVFMMGMSNIVAGSDTTAVSLSSILWHLTTHPSVLAQLRQELDTAIAEGKMSRDRITFKESQDLPFLQACIKEALRMCAATGLPLWRVVPAGGVEMLGQYFPEGTEVGINSWVAHYDEDVWGKDAREYRPQRWIEAQEDKERLREMETFYMPFGLGSRTCIGRHISFLEMCKVIPMIVSNFDFALTKPTTELKTENFWFVRPTEFNVQVKLRKQE